MDNSDIEAVIQKAQVCRIALVDGNQPYVVPVCFGHRDGKLYFHSSLRGRKMGVLRRNDRVCVEFEVDVGLARNELPCKFSFRFIFAHVSRNRIKLKVIARKALHRF